MKSIWRLLTWHVHELLVQIGWRLNPPSWGRCRKILFLDPEVSERVRRGRAYRHEQYDLYVLYLAYNPLRSRTEERSLFLYLEGQNRIWIDGWSDDEAKALLSMEALR